MQKLVFISNCILACIRRMTFTFTRYHTLRQFIGKQFTSFVTDNFGSYLPMSIFCDSLVNNISVFINDHRSKCVSYRFD